MSSTIANRTRSKRAQYVYEHIPVPNRQVLDAIEFSGDDTNQLIQALTMHSHLIDTPERAWLHRRPMHLAAEKGNVTAIETLVLQGSNAIDTPDRKGFTPLHRAAENGHAAVVEVLVRLGSQAIDTPNKNDHTPLYTAASKGHAATIETLVRLGSNVVDIPDNDGRTPLFMAAENAHASTIEALVRSGSKAIDTLDDHDGWTPLHAAASGKGCDNFLRRVRGHDLAIEALIRMGSNATDTPDKYGRCPLSIALQRWSTDSNATVLKALATNPTTPLPFGAHNPYPPTEETVVAVRFRVYFGRSLVLRMLFELDRLSNTKGSTISTARTIETS